MFSGVWLAAGLRGEVVPDDRPEVGLGFANGVEARLGVRVGPGFGAEVGGRVFVVMQEM